MGRCGRVGQWLQSNIPRPLGYEIVAAACLLVAYAGSAHYSGDPVAWLADHFRYVPPRDTRAHGLDSLLSTFKLAGVWCWLKGWRRFSREGYLLRPRLPRCYFATRALIVVNAVPLSVEMGNALGVALAHLTS